MYFVQSYVHIVNIVHVCACICIQPTCICLFLDVIKISDFGLSTVFKHNGKERKLIKSCGTPPYIAPEVL